MTIETEIKIEGLAEIDARLAELGALAGKKLLTRAVRRSLFRLEKTTTGNANAISRSGALAQSVKIVTARPKVTETVAVQVGPKKRDRRALALRNIYYRRKDKGIFYGHLVEYGHRIATRATGWLRKGKRTTGAGGTAKGSVPGKPWFRPAWDATRAGIVPEFRRVLAQGLARIEKRNKQRTVDRERLVDP
jgi:hypothetical protein